MSVAFVIALVVNYFSGLLFSFSLIASRKLSADFIAYCASYLEMMPALPYAALGTNIKLPVSISVLALPSGARKTCFTKFYQRCL